MVCCVFTSWYREKFRVKNFNVVLEWQKKQDNSAPIISIGQTGSISGRAKLPQSISLLLISERTERVLSRDKMEEFNMARIAGVDLPREKRVEIGLTYIYGIGRVSSNKILEKAGVNPDVRVRDLTDDDVKKISAIIDEE